MGPSPRRPGPEPVKFSGFRPIIATPIVRPTHPHPKFANKSSAFARELVFEPPADPVIRQFEPPWAPALRPVPDPAEDPPVIDLTGDDEVIDLTADTPGRVTAVNGDVLVTIEGLTLSMNDVFGHT